MGKVFGIGMFKTGTKSLGTALSILGYKGTYRPWFVLQDNWYRDTENWNKRYKMIKKEANNFNAFSDAPWLFLYKELDQWFPGSKFILTIRKNPLTQAQSDLHEWRNKPENKRPTLQDFMQRYTLHNKLVYNYFKDKNNLLVMCFEKGDGFKELCTFLNKPLPIQSFPHVHKSNRKK